MVNQRRKLRFAAAATLLVAGSAGAQSNVLIHGTFDAGLSSGRHTAKGGLPGSLEVRRP